MAELAYQIRNEICSRFIVMRVRGIRLPVCLLAALIIFAVLHALRTNHGEASNQFSKGTQQTQSQAPTPGDITNPANRVGAQFGGDQERLLELPRRTIQLLQIDAIDDTTGRLNSKMTEMLLFTVSEASKVNRVFAGFFTRFLEIEVNHSTLVNAEGESYILARDCSSEAKPLFAALLVNLTEILGRQRAEAVVILVEKELRKGGAEPLEVGHVIIEENGDSAITLRGGPYGQTEIRGRLDQFYRWRVLSDRYITNR